MQKQMPPEVKMAIGRIMMMLSRPAQPGDVETYESCRRVIFAAADEEGRKTSGWYTNDYRAHR